MKKILAGSCVLFVLISACKKKSEEAVYTPNIIYTDIRDTVVLANDSVLLDINVDSSPDIMIYGQRKRYVSSGGSSGAHYQYFNGIVSLKSDVMLSYGSVSQFQMNCFLVNSPITSSSTWTSSLNLNATYPVSGPYGCWDNNPHDGYIGVRFVTGNGMRFAWVRLADSIYSNSLTIYDFAINNDYDRPINAGQKN